MIFSSLLTFLSASTLFISSLSSLFTPTRAASRQVDETKVGSVAPSNGTYSFEEDGFKIPLPSPRHSGAGRR